MHYRQGLKLGDGSAVRDSSCALVGGEPAAGAFLSSRAKLQHIKSP